MLRVTHALDGTQIAHLAWISVGGASQHRVDRGASAEIASPLGPLLLAVSAVGVTRLAFPEQRDAQPLLASSNKRAAHGPRRQLKAATSELERYFAGTSQAPGCQIDWAKIGDRVRRVLEATLEIPLR